MNKSESKYFNTAIRFDKALLLLLEKKPFEYISVSEICKEANVNRSTFYLHYENLRDLLEETMQYLIDEFISYFPFYENSITEQFSNCELCDLNFINEKYLHPYLSYIKENQRAFSTVLSHPATFDIDAVFGRLFKYVFNPILKRFNYPEEDRKYVMMFYLSGINAIITQWLKDECQKSIEEITDIIRCCIFGKSLKLDFTHQP